MSETTEVEVVEAVEPEVKEEAVPTVAPIATATTTNAVVASEDLLRGRRKVRLGRVVSNKMEQTVVVATEQIIRHPLYGKTMRRTKKFKAHDVDNSCGVGDTVEIMETRPISKDKRWRVVRIVERAK